MGTVVRESHPLTAGKADRSGPLVVLPGVLLCGEESQWGYGYPLDLWTDETLRAYEGLPAYRNHGKANELRDVNDKFAFYTKPRRGPDGRPVGDQVILNADGDFEKRLIAAYEHRPDLFCLSHVAAVEYGTRGGKKVVTKVTPVSVDVVDKGATTNSLRESAPPGGRAVPTTVKEYAAKLGQRCDVDQLLKVRLLVKEGFGDAPMMADAPAADAAETDPADGISAAFKAAIMHVIDDCMCNDGDPKEYLGKIKKLLGAHADVNGGGAPVEADAEAKEAARAAAAKAGTTVVAESGILDELVREGFAPSATQLAALRGMTDPATRTAFIREQKGMAAATKARAVTREQVAAAAAGTAKEGAAGAAAPTGVEAARRAMAAESARLRGATPSAN